MIGSLIDYFFAGDQSKKEQAAKIVTAAIAVVTVALSLLQQVSAALK